MSLPLPPPREQGLLVNTVQRLPRYVLLLRELLEHAKSPELQAHARARAPEQGDGDAGGAMVHAVEAALEKIKGVTGRVDSRVGDAERRQRAMVVARDVLKRDDLVAPSRALLREGPLTKLRRDKWGARCHRSSRQAFLFNDKLVLHAEGQACARPTPSQPSPSQPSPPQLHGATLESTPGLARSHPDRPRTSRGSAPACSTSTRSSSSPTACATRP